MKDKNKTRIEILLEEYNRLHQDRRNWDNNIFQLFVLLITITSLGVTAVLQQRTQSVGINPTTVNETFNFWDYFIMAYPYITYLFTLIFLVLSGVIVQNSTTLFFIENRINELVDQKVLFWENVIVSKTQYKISSTYFLASILLCVFFIILDIYCIGISLSLFEGTILKNGYIILNSICITFLVSLLLYHLKYEKKIIEKRLIEFTHK